MYLFSNRIGSTEFWPELPVSFLPAGTPTTINIHYGFNNIHSHLVGKGVFSSWNDYNTFQDVKIGSSGELVWSDQIDIFPDSLYLKITNQKPEILFPNLKQNELLSNWGRAQGQETPNKIEPLK